MGWDPGFLERFSCCSGLDKVTSQGPLSPGFLASTRKQDKVGVGEWGVGSDTAEFWLLWDPELDK